VVRKQVEQFLEGLDRPESFAGSVFLEELPCHFSAAPFRQDWSALAQEWGIGQQATVGKLPWDIRRFHEQVRTELGQPFDMLNESHRLWWGRKYVEVLAEIHKAMKAASRGRTVLYWHQTMFNTMDHLKPGQTIFTPGIVPISYRDIVKPGLCDGIFGYPNSARIWSRQTQAVVQKLNCLLFSQLAQRPTLRLSRFGEQVALSRWEHPGNLGAFLYAESGRRWRAWNQLPYPEDDSYWTVRDYSRRFAWDYKIGMDVIAAHLAPRAQLDYSVDGLKRHGFAHFQALVQNPRDPSWYGGSKGPAVLHNVEVTLRVPAGFSIPLENNAGATLGLGTLGPRECILADWWIRLDKDKPSIPAGGAFRLSVRADGVETSTAAFSTSGNRVGSFDVHPVSRSGDTWVEPALQLPAGYTPVAEIRCLQGEVLHPRLVCGSRSAVYRGTLEAKNRLVIGPGVRGTLFRDPLLAHSFSGTDKSNGTVFTKGYHVHSSRRVRVKSGRSFRLRVTGWSKDGGNCHAIAHFTGKRSGKAESVDQSCIANRFTEEPSTAETKLTVPQFDKGEATLVFYFYRIRSKGKVCYQSYELRSLDIPEDGLNVDDRIDGALADLEPPFTIWRYEDLSDPARYGDAKIEVRFLPPRGTPEEPHER